MKTYYKSKLISLVICVSITLTWQSCTKNSNESVEGRVLEYGTNKPIPNATVYLMEVKGTFLGPSGSSKIDSTTSDHNGRYKFTYMDNPYVSEIRGKANLYYDNYAYIMGTGKKLKTDLILDPHAWLRLKINAPDKDVFQFVIHTFGCNPREFLIHDGEKSAETLCQLKGNRENRVEFNIGIYGGISINEIINPYLPALDTTTLELNY